MQTATISRAINKNKRIRKHGKAAAASTIKIIRLSKWLKIAMNSI